MSVNSKMTALADEIRVLSGTEDAMGLDDMASHVGEANTNVSTEADLIAQITTALEGKSAGDSSGSSGGETIEACSGKISYALLPTRNTVTYTDSTLNYITVDILDLTNINVAKNTIVFIGGANSKAVSGCTRLGGGYGEYCYLITHNNFEIQVT